MLRQFKPRYRSFLGVDLGSTSIKIVEISGPSSNYCIEGYGYDQLPFNALETSREIVVSSIKKILVRIKASTKIAAIAVPDSIVITKAIQLADSLTDLEIEELIFLEADKLLAYPPNKINVDYVVLGPSKISFGMIDVLILASREDNIHARVELLKDAGLDTRVVDMESYAIASFYEYSEKDSSKLLAVFDIAYDSLRLFILENKKIIYTREDTFDCQKLFISIAKHYKVTIEEARFLFNQKLKPLDYGSEFLNPFLKLTAVEITRSLNYFFSMADNNFIDRIILSGEIVGLWNLPTFVRQETGVQTYFANPFSRLPLSKSLDSSKAKNYSSIYLLALGLALRLANDH
ncbi:MAG: type IV pilus assembly protein PilM [Tatlockia sp.]|nr:type IV pilus assembly protein PilM [Tatlockia sp.]